MRTSYRAVLSFCAVCDSRPSVLREDITTMVAQGGRGTIAPASTVLCYEARQTAPGRLLLQSRTGTVGVMNT